jgi:hypothetical protein
MRLRSPASAIALALLLGLVVGAVLGGSSGCIKPSQTFALVTQGAPSSTGSVSVERIEGGQRLVVLQFDGLPPPERLGPGVREFVVWLEGPHGKKVKIGTLRYDRDHRSGNLLATTELRAFTVRVTGERNAQASEPSDVLLAERRVVTN